MATFREIVAYSAKDMFSWYKNLIVNIVFFHLGFWNGNLFLIAHFPDRCLLVYLYFIFDKPQTYPDDRKKKKKEKETKEDFCDTYNNLIVY